MNNPSRHLTSLRKQFKSREQSLISDSIPKYCCRWIHTYSPCANVGTEPFPTMNGVPAEQQAPPTAESASAETRLQGHVGYLTNEEEVAFEEFKKLSVKEGYYTAATDEHKASHDDGTLMCVVRPSCVSLTANIVKVGTCEHGNSSLWKHLHSSRTQRYGANKTT